MKSTKVKTPLSCGNSQKGRISHNIRRQGTKSIAPYKIFYNANGQVFAKIGTDGVLRKSEKERDRLRIFGGKSHAMDEELFQECLSLGVLKLEIREKTDNGASRVWSIPITDVEKYGKEVTLRGVPRRTIPLTYCELLSGPAESWYLAERNARIEETSSQKKQRIVQERLFPKDESHSWQSRWRFES